MAFNVTPMASTYQNTIGKQALQQALGSRFKVDEGPDKNYTISYSAGKDVWKPVVTTPSQYSYTAASPAPASTGVQALAQALKQFSPYWQGTTPSYYEYQAQQPQTTDFNALYGFSPGKAQLSGGQKVYQTVGEQASWMSPQDQQAFLQQAAQKYQQALNSSLGSAAPQGAANIEQANLAAQAASAAGLRQSISQAISNQVLQALAQAAYNKYLSDMQVYQNFLGATR